MADPLKIFELAANEPIFPLATFGLTAEDIDTEHNYLIDLVLGKSRPVDESTLKEYVSQRLPSDFATFNALQLSSFLAEMLQFDPKRRRSTAELLRNPFLTDGSSHSGDT